MKNRGMIGEPPAPKTGWTLFWAMQILFTLVAVAFVAAFFIRGGDTIPRTRRSDADRPSVPLRPSSPPSSDGVASSASEPGKAALQRPRHPWPPKETLIHPSPGGTDGKEAQDPSGLLPPEAARPLPGGKPLEEPPQPAPGEIRAVSQWAEGEAETLRKAQDLLLDPRSSSTLKLAALEKVRTLPPEQAVPLLVRFLESPAPPGGEAYTKPTAVKALVDFKHPLAEAALEHLSKAPDDRVRLAVQTLRHEGRRP